MLGWPRRVGTSRRWRVKPTASASSRSPSRRPAKQPCGVSTKPSGAADAAHAQLGRLPPRVWPSRTPRACPPRLEGSLELALDPTGSRAEGESRPRRSTRRGRLAVPGGVDARWDDSDGRVHPHARRTPGALGDDLSGLFPGRPAPRSDPRLRMSCCPGTSGDAAENCVLNTGPTIGAPRSPAPIWCEALTAC